MIEHATGQTLVRMELKYCEGCGGLLLRRAGETLVYCAGCQTKLNELAQSEPATLPSEDGATGVPHRYPSEVGANAASAAPKIPPRAVSTKSADSRRMA